MPGTRGAGRLLNKKKVDLHPAVYVIKGSKHEAEVKG